MVKKITFKDKALSLVGRELKINTSASNFVVVSKELKDVALPDYNDKIKIIHSFPSLDTQVCDSQVKEFNNKALNLSDEIVILGISKDLPFAQNRFCSQFSINNIFLFSDYKTSSFGINYGLLIKELNLLARSSIILDKNNVIRYIQITKDLTDKLDYNELFNKLNDVVKNPKIKIEPQILPLKCKPCETTSSSLQKDKILKLFKLLDHWELLEDKKIQKELKFNDFIEAKYFLDLIALIAEEQNHHPSFYLNYNKLTISLTTHKAKGLTENDFVMGKIIDELSKS
jgi:thioredoxin-dependent peroxiredoxin